MCSGICKYDVESALEDGRPGYDEGGVCLSIFAVYLQTASNFMVCSN